MEVQIYSVHAFPLMAIVGEKANTVSSATGLPDSAVLGFVGKVKGTGCSQSKMGENSACIMLAQQDRPEMRVWSVGRSLAKAIEGDHSPGCDWEIKYAECSSSLCVSCFLLLSLGEDFMSWTLTLFEVWVISKAEHVGELVRIVTV